jgi:succinylglutamate desuccinylase
MSQFHLKGNINQNIYNFFKENQNDEVPFVINYDTQKEGAHIVFVIGSHGNEPGALSGALKLYQDIQEKPEILNGGKITWILGNPEAVKRDQKFIYSDLNQTFSSKIKTGAEYKRTLEIAQYFESNPDIDLVLDLYSSIKNKPRMAFYSLNEFETLKLMAKISRFSLYVNVNQEYFPGTLVLEAAKSNIICFALSFGNEKLDKTSSIAYDIQVAALEKYLLLDKKVLEKEKLLSKPPFIDIYYPRETIKVAEEFAFTNEDIKTGDLLKKGEIYATYKNGHHIAHEDSYVLLLTKKIKRDNLGFLCKKYTLVTEKPQQVAETSTQEEQKDNEVAKVETIQKS